MICYVTDADGREIYCVQTGLAFLNIYSVNKIAFIVLRGEFEAVGSRS